MKEKLTIKDVEELIEFCEFILSTPSISMNYWNDTISKYHALNIKLCQMKGESPIVAYHQPEHIV